MKKGLKDFAVLSLLAIATGMALQVGMAVASQCFPRQYVVCVQQPGAEIVCPAVKP